MSIPPFIPQHHVLVDELLDRRASSTLRWHTKPTTRPENIAEHQYFTAYCGFILAAMAGLAGVDVSSRAVLLLGLLHDSAEEITGDVPGSLKRINEEAGVAASRWEHDALPLLWGGLPNPLADCLRHHAGRFIQPEDCDEWRIARFADLWGAYSFVHAEVEVFHNDGLRAVRDQTAKELYLLWQNSKWSRAIATRIDDSIGAHLRGVLVAIGELVEVRT